MEKLQARGDSSEEELRALEMDVTGKVAILNFFLFFPSRFYVPLVSPILLASWRGARLEVIQVLREVRH